MNEFLNGIRIVKLFAWEDAAIKKVAVARSEELRILWRILILNAIVAIIWALLSLFVTLGAFILHTAVLKRELTPAVAFTSMSLFTLLKGPMSIIPWCINAALSAYTSLKRIHCYLEVDNCDGFQNRLETCSSVDNKISIMMSNASFNWSMPNSDPVADIGVGTTWYRDLYSRCCNCFQHRNDYSALGQNELEINAEERDIEMGNLIDSAVSPSDNVSGDVDDQLHPGYNGHSNVSPTLSHNTLDSAVVKKISCSIEIGSLVVIAGLTGSGKSSLISGILGECSMLNNVHDAQCKLIFQSQNNSGDKVVSYASQSTWIFNATVKENILFGSIFDKERYDKVIFACALVEDLNSFEFGDNTEIGEKGVNLSGGQQQRVNLARAAYANSQIIIMDDPLSAVDAHVGSHIFKHLICNFLLGRTRILSTHLLSLAIPNADYVMVLGSTGTLLAYSHPKDLPDKLNQYCIPLHSQKKFEYSNENRARNNSNVNEFSFADTESYCAAIVDIVEHMSDSSKIELSSPTSEPLLETVTLENGSMEQNQNKFVQDESKATGSIGWPVYWFYISACGGLAVGLIWLTLSVSIVITSTYQNYALGEWVRYLELQSHNGIAKSSIQSSFNLYLVALLLAVTTTITRQFFQLYFSLSGAKVIILLCFHLNFMFCTVRHFMIKWLLEYLCRRILGLIRLLLVGSLIGLLKIFLLWIQLLLIRYRNL